MDFFAGYSRKSKFCFHALMLSSNVASYARPGCFQTGWLFVTLMFHMDSEWAYWYSASKHL